MAFPRVTTVLASLSRDTGGCAISTAEGLAVRVRIHTVPSEVLVEHERLLAARLFSAANASEPDELADREIANPTGLQPILSMPDVAIITVIRGQLLSVPPQRFEHIVKKTLECSGFENVTVTQYSQDGGVDVNAYAGTTMWPVRNLHVQIQAKRWLHTVGRREVAELRSSLQPHARGTVITTSHFSRAAISEASDPGKYPIVLVDGYAFASIVHQYGIDLS